MGYNGMKIGQNKLFRTLSYSSTGPKDGLTG